jgi:hypothetical protein
MTGKTSKAFDSINLDDPNLSAAVTGGKTVDQKARVGRKLEHFQPQEMKLSVRIPKSMHKLIKFASYREGRPIVSVAYAALEEYLQRHEAAFKKIESIK